MTTDKMEKAQKILNEIAIVKSKIKENAIKISGFHRYSLQVVSLGSGGMSNELIQTISLTDSDIVELQKILDKRNDRLRNYLDKLTKEFEEL